MANETNFEFYIYTASVRIPKTNDDTLRDAIRGKESELSFYSANKSKGKCKAIEG